MQHSEIVEPIPVQVNRSDMYLLNALSCATQSDREAAYWFAADQDQLGLAAGPV